MAATATAPRTRIPLWPLVVVVTVVALLGYVIVRLNRPAPPPYTPQQKAIIAAWMDKNRRDAPWINSIRDHIVAQGMLFKADDDQERLYLVHGLKPSQVLTRTMWPFLKQGFICQNFFAGISRMDLPSTDEYDQYGIDYMPAAYSYEWTRGSKATGTGPYWLRDINTIHIGRELGSEDEVISEDYEIFDSSGFGSQKMVELAGKFGFNPKRDNWSGDPKEVMTPVPPQKKHVIEPLGLAFQPGPPARREPWLDSLRPHITSTKSTPPDGDERREYELSGVKLSEVVHALRAPLSKVGLNADTSIYDTDKEMDGRDLHYATFLPEKWSPDAAKLGVVAVEAVHDEGASNIRIIELYGLPMTK